MFQIGFTGSSQQDHAAPDAAEGHQSASAPRKSLVQVYFPDRKMNLAYYNECFDLHPGDLVYVDGKLEGLQGFVTEVLYNFKIRLSDYRRVIAVADTSIQGQFFLAGSHLLSFDQNALPFEKVRSWFLPPSSEEDYVSGFDSSSFPLNDLQQMGVSEAVAERGHDYYMHNRVVYLRLDGSHGQAIVEGSQAYLLEFCFEDGQISRLTCNCYCSFRCKHEFAAMLQLRETLALIERNYAAMYRKSGCFSAVEKQILLRFAFRDGQSGSVTFSQN